MIGFINVNKPKGLTSAQVVNRVKKLLNLDRATKVGHTGTLDPLALGVLPIAIGKATKLFDFMLSKTKEYEAEFTFGYETDSLDSAGKVVAKCEKIPTKQEIEEKLTSFTGEISQIPPLFSAKSVNGVRAYTLARKGKLVNLKPSVVEVVKFELIGEVDSKTFRFKIECGSGTYIRSLCRDLAYSLRTYATMTSLIRTRVGVFDLNNSVLLDEVCPKNILPCEVVLTKLDDITIDAPTLNRLKNGQRVEYRQIKSLFKVWCENSLQGLGYVEGNNLKMKIWLS